LLNANSILLGHAAIASINLKHVHYKEFVELFDCVSLPESRVPESGLLFAEFWLAFFEMRGNI
jgi:hypothetical protein